MPVQDQAAYRRKRRAAGKDRKRSIPKPENIRAASARYRRLHPERIVKRSKPKSPEYNRKFQEQNGLCAICGKPEPVNGRCLADDHDHKSGKRRGLLCSLCNCGLGLLQDDPFVLQKALDYLKSYGK